MALGKGLDALFLDKNSPLDNGPDIKDRILQVPLTQVEPNREQARRRFDTEGLEDLSQSIREHGILSPLLVKKMGAAYQIIAGERRWRAARMAGLVQVPVIVLAVSEQKAMEISLIENLQRENLNPIEEALGLRDLLARFSLTQEQVAARVGKSRSAIANLLRLLNLPREISDMLAEGQLSAGHARALLPLKKERQLELSTLIVQKDLSVRETERLAAQKEGGKNGTKKQAKNPDAMYLADLQQQLSGRLGRRVVIQGHPTKKQGKITLDYYDYDDLERLLVGIDNK